MPKTLRSGRLNEEIMREVSDIVKNGMKDPRISQMTSVLRAEVTRDLSFAKVYVSVYGDEACLLYTSSGRRFSQPLRAWGLNWWT